ncbi:MAG TPA: FmdB family zinc ribbon protein [Candidatus Angelobacter sp.]
MPLQSSIISDISKGSAFVPLYEYQCKKCRHRFEKIQKFSDRPVKKCPQCGGPVEQLLSAPAVQFKGEGWYVTDYARKGSGSSESAEGAKDGSSSKATDKSEKTDSKKAEKKPDKTAKK